MADLKTGNSCIGCKHYESEANDYYYQWCHHPNVDAEGDKGKYLYQEYDNNSYSDYTYFVSICPLTGKPPY